MRSSIFFAAPFAALAMAQSTANVTVTASTLSTVPYTNGFTSFLTQTNSLGVVTGMPSVATNAGTAITTQPAVALVPAGFTGVTSLYFGGNGTIPTSTLVITADSSSTFAVSVVRTTTNAATASGSSASGSASQSGSGTSASASRTASGSGSASASGSGTATGSASVASSSTGAAAHIYVASSALVGAGALFAAFL